MDLSQSLESAFLIPLVYPEITFGKCSRSHRVGEDRWLTQTGRLIFVRSRLGISYLSPTMNRFLPTFSSALLAVSLPAVANDGAMHDGSRGPEPLEKTESPVRMADIAAALDVVPRTATSIVDALEAAGLVARSADASDRRAVLVRLTDDGRELQERLRWARVRAADEALAPLSESERAELARLLAMVCWL